MAQVNITSQDECAACALKGSCNPTGEGRVMWALNNKGGEVGDEVVVELKPSVKVMGSALVFIGPLAGLFGGCLLGYVGGKTQDYAVVGGLSGVIFAFVIMRIIDRKLYKKSNLRPIITRVLN